MVVSYYVGILPGPLEERLLYLTAEPCMFPLTNLLYMFHGEQTGKVNTKTDRSILESRWKYCVSRIGKSKHTQSYIKVKNLLWLRRPKIII